MPKRTNRRAELQSEKVAELFDGRVVHVMLPARAWRSLRSQFIFSGENELTNEIGMTISHMQWWTEKYCRDLTQWIVLTPLDHHPSGELLDRLVLNPGDGVATVSGNVVHCGIAAALAHDLGFRPGNAGEEGENGTAPALEPQALCLPINPGLRQIGAVSRLQMLQSPVWVIEDVPGDYMPWQTILNRPIEECRRDPEGSVIVCSEVVASRLSEQGLNLIVPTRGLSADLCLPENITAIWLCLPVTLDLFAALLRLLQRKLRTNTRVNGYFYDFLECPEHCYVVSTFLGTPETVKTDGVWRTSDLAGLTRRFSRDESFLQPLQFGEARSLNRIHKGVAIIGSAADHLDHFASLASSLRDADANLQVLLLDTGAISEPVLMACTRWSVRYRNLATTLLRMGEAGRFLEACSWLPSGHWIIADLANPLASQAVQLVARSPAVGNDIACVSDSSAEHRIMTLLVCMAVVGLISEQELGSIKKNGTFPCGILQLSINENLTALWLSLHDNCDGVGNSSMDQAAAIMLVVALRSGQNMKGIQPRPHTATPLSVLIREGRPSLRLPPDGTATILLIPPASTETVARLSAWRWKPGSRIRLLTTEANRQLLDELLASWKAADVKVATLPGGSRKQVVSVADLVPADGPPGIIYLIDPQLEPSPGAVFYAPAEDQAWDCFLAEGGPTLARTPSIKTFEIGSRGEISRIETSGGAVLHYNAERLGWKEVTI